MVRNNLILRRLVIGTFLSVPAISSAISMVHLVDLFNLGNPVWLSILLAITFELGSIASLLAISVIEKINTYAIWFIFFVLSALQIVGNIYYSYTFTSVELLANQNFLSTFTELFSFITGDDVRDAKLFLSCIIGIPIPLIALFFLKSNMDYLKLNKKKDKAEEEKELSEAEPHSNAFKKAEDSIVAVEATEEDLNAEHSETGNNTHDASLESEGEDNDEDEYGDFYKIEDSDIGALNEYLTPEEPRRRKTRVIGNAKIKY